MQNPEISQGGSNLDAQWLKLETLRLQNDALQMKMKMEKQKGIQEERKSLQEALMGLIKTLPTEDAD